MKQLLRSPRKSYLNTGKEIQYSRTQNFSNDISLVPFDCKYSVCTAQHDCKIRESPTNSPPLISKVMNNLILCPAIIFRSFQRLQGHCKRDHRDGYPHQPIAPRLDVLPDCAMFPRTSVKRVPPSQWKLLPHKLLKHSFIISIQVQLDNKAILPLPLLHPL